MTIKSNADALFDRLSSCDLCPRRCGVDRKKGVFGFCKAGAEIAIASKNIHNGEEPPISGRNGSGTIFFTYCNLNCVFCQNYPISQLMQGKEISQNELAKIMLSLQERKAHNINLVSPTHFTAQIAQAIIKARDEGLIIPIVYNCGGYESISALKLLAGLIDIYMPDCKYADDKLAIKYSNAPSYVEANRAAIFEMLEQVGHLEIDENGLAKKGLLIRHLVLPGEVENSKKVLDFIAHDISCDTYISLMSQYHKAYRAAEFENLNRKLKYNEYEQVLEHADKLGLQNGWRQEV